NHIRLRDSHRQWCQILLWIIGQVAVYKLVVYQRAGNGNTKSIAIRFGLGDLVGTNIAPGTGFVLNDDRLTQFLFGIAGNNTGNLVRSGSRTKWNNQRKSVVGPLTLI